MTSFLQLMLLVNAFMAGLITMPLIRYAKHHFAQRKLVVTKPNQDENEGPSPSIDPEISLKLGLGQKSIVDQAQAKYEAILTRAAGDFQSELGSTASQVNDLVKKLAAEIVGEELEHYRQYLAQMGQKSNTDLSAIREQIDQHSAQVKEKINQDLEAHKKVLIDQLDNKLSDAVASFLVEVLGKNVDLGTQQTYLTELLEQHKADFIKEVTDDQTTVA